jgi:hypothetical protein
MKKKLDRATDGHLVLAALKQGKPKPEKQAKVKRAKIMPKRKMLEQQIEAISKLIVFWRDGCQCVEANIDGVRCGGGNQWGHYVPRQQSRWLKYNLGNTYCQCRNHNNLHDKGAQTMGVWFASTFGTPAALAMEKERDTHRGEKNMTVQDLEELLAHYDELYQNRYTAELTLGGLVLGGYYGATIKAVFDGE